MQHKQALLLKCAQQNPTHSTVALLTFYSSPSILQRIFEFVWSLICFSRISVQELISSFSQTRLDSVGSLHTCYMFCHCKQPEDALPRRNYPPADLWGERLHSLSKYTSLFNKACDLNSHILPLHVSEIGNPRFIFLWAPLWFVAFLHSFCYKLENHSNGLGNPFYYWTTLWSLPAVTQIQNICLTHLLCGASSYCGLSSDTR